MAETKEKRSLLTKLSDKYRLVILNDTSFEEVFGMRLSRLNVFLVVSTSFILFSVVLISLILFTSLKEFVPGYPDANTRLAIIENAILVDSLSVELEKRDNYIRRIQNILEGKIPEDEGHTVDIPEQAPANEKISFAKSETDSMFRKRVEAEEKYNLGIEISGVRSELTNLNFFPPVKGIVTNSFNAGINHYGVDIVSTPNKRISAVLNGTVVLATWTLETGYTMQIQHGHNLISVYKHNSKLLKEEGSMVEAGEAIALMGNSGEITTGPHLHFELWLNGKPINPEDYIVF